MSDDEVPDEVAEELEEDGEEEESGSGWPLIAGGLVLGLAIAAFGGVYFQSEKLFKRTYDVALPTISVPVGDSQAIAEGERLGVVHGCVGCHTSTLGGKVAFDTPLYQLNSADLTKGDGGVGSYSDAHLARAHRSGRGRARRKQASLGQNGVYAGLLHGWNGTGDSEPRETEPETAIFMRFQIGLYSHLKIR